MTSPVRAELLARYILAMAAQRNRWVSKTYVLKVMYLCDLAEAEFKGSSVTGAPWYFHTFGPFDGATVHSIEDEFRSPHVQVFGGSESDGSMIGRLYLDDAELEELESGLSVRTTSTVRRALSECSDLPSILQRVYETAPMLQAKPGDRLQLRPIADPEVPHEPAAQAPGLSKTQLKRRAEARAARIAEVKKVVNEKLEAAIAEKRSRNAGASPIYDDAYFSFVRALDEDRPDVELKSIRVDFDGEIWTSDMRRAKDG